MPLDSLHRIFHPPTLLLSASASAFSLSLIAASLLIESRFYNLAGHRRRVVANSVRNGY